jgi:DNA ligase (NAD+)
MDKAKETYQSLVDKAKAANAAYYDNDDPLMTDYEYDSLMLKIKALEKEHPEFVTKDSPTQYVGGTPSKSSFAKVTHAVPMLSLRDVFSKNDITNFLSQYPANTLYSVEEKIDGLSASVTYGKDGRMVRGESRGDSIIGEDITENIKFVKGIPPMINLASIKDKISLLEIRCEVYMPVEEFERVNAECEAAGKKPFANPRNAAAGILRTKDTQAVKNANLAAFVFNIQRIEFDGESDSRWNYHCFELNQMEKLGFTPVFHRWTGPDGVMDLIDEIGKRRNTLPYWIDGAVVKMDTITERQEAGETAKYPKWAVAYKYPPEEKETVIRDIILQTGRTGRVTPVAVFDPVFLAGTKVERATLHNPENIAMLGVDIGSEVTVRKEAEIIPAVIAVKRSTGSVYNVFAHKCPSCGGRIVHGADENGENESGAYCMNPDCPAQISRKFEFWGSRDCMDIAGFGPAIVDKFITLGWLKTIPDIYRLKEHKEEMMKLDGFGKKAAENLLDAIEKSKDRDIDRLIKSLGIPGVGRHIGKRLAKLYPDMDAIKRLSIGELSCIDGIGNISAQAMFEWFNDIGGTNHEEMLRTLQALGVNIKSKSFSDSKVPAGPGSMVFTGKTFVITGTLPTMKREEAASLIEANGGTVSGSVSKKTDYLLCGENAGSKLDKANALGIMAITEKDLTDMLI